MHQSAIMAAPSKTFMKRAKKTCNNYPSCKNLTDTTYCEDCQPKIKKQRYRDKSAPHQSMYNRQWRNARAAFLTANPQCVECERRNILKPAEVVDHIIPHRGDTRLFWDRKNWQPLCKRCHDIKTNKEKRRLT
jgi:5-methylcytosine-specific restriction protein A